MRVAAGIFLVVAVRPVLAQDYPKVSVLFGAAFSGIDRGPISDSVLPPVLFPDCRENFTGFIFSPAIAVRRYLRIVVSEFGGQYRYAGVKDNGEPQRSETFQLLFGPEFTSRSNRATWFAHALIGLGRTQRSTVANGHGVSEDDTGLLFALGGGVDFKLSRTLALRAAQVDYMPGRPQRHQLGRATDGSIIQTWSSRTTPGSWRVCVGIVIHIE